MTKKQRPSHECFNWYQLPDKWPQYPSRYMTHYLLISLFKEALNRRYFLVIQTLKHSRNTQDCFICVGFLMYFIHVLFRPPIQCFFKQAYQQITGHIPTWILRPLIRQLISVETFMGRALVLSHLDAPTQQKYQIYIGFLICLIHVLYRPPIQCFFK